MPDADPSACAAMARAQDPDRFFAAMLAPRPQRETLLVLIAFNAELAHAATQRNAQAGAFPALLRLQWWREVLEGRPERHEVAAPLHAALAAGLLRREPLDAMLQAFEDEVEGAVPDEALFMAGAGVLAEEMGRVLGAGEAFWPRLRHLGAGYEAARRWRRHGDASMRELGSRLLQQAPVARLGRAQRPAAFAGVLAARDLAREGGADIPRGLGDRMAMLRYWLTGVSPRSGG